MLTIPGHVFGPRGWILKAGENRWLAALQSIYEHQRHSIVVELGSRWTAMFHPETNKWYEKSKARIKLTVSLHESGIGRTQPGGEHVRSGLPQTCNKRPINKTYKLLIERSQWMPRGSKTKRTIGQRARGMARIFEHWPMLLTHDATTSNSWVLVLITTAI